MVSYCLGKPSCGTSAVTVLNSATPAFPMSDGSALSLLSTSGKVQLKALSRRKQHEQKRHERRLLARQLRNNKRQEALQRHRERGTASTPPLLVALVSLHQAAPPQQALSLLTAADPDLTVTRSEQGVTHVRSVGNRIGQQYGHAAPVIYMNRHTACLVILCFPLLGFCSFAADLQELSVFCSISLEST